MTADPRTRDGQRTWLERLSTPGLIGRGALYGIVGVLALRIAMGSGGGEADAQGAVQALANRPFGSVLLVALAIGLAGYACWRAAQALWEADRDGLHRVKSAGRAVLYGGLCAMTVGVLLGRGGGSSSESTLTARLLALPGGVAVVVAAGLVLAGVGVAQVHRAVTRRFCDELDHALVDKARLRTITPIGMVGLTGRGLTFALVGGFLVRAALQHDPDEGVGLDGALRELAQQPFGTAALVVVAVGLLVYALYVVMLARYGDASELD